LKLNLRTTVAQAPAQVMAGFTRELFVALAPPFPKMRLRRYDGSRRGNLVEIELDALVKKLAWTSLITDDGVLPDGTHYFVDEGQVLPPPLHYWRHRHLLQPGPAGGTVIVEDLEYRTRFGWLDALLRPAMWAMLAWRKPIYRRWFQ
jgi:ligand-binding SRPBCC domain-containing protein